MTREAVNRCIFVVSAVLVVLSIAIAITALQGCGGRKVHQIPFWKDCNEIAYNVATQAKTFRCTTNDGHSYLVDIRIER